ncbi:MAG: hypothetical protein LQ346_007262 [Caloplaca aetnensis]|nr:MAG: hypothetical protein LQ346_007262 [Caloplaca aetnensis]
MASSRHTQYRPLQHWEEDEALLSNTTSATTSLDQSDDAQRASKKPSWYKTVLPWILHGALLLTSASMLAFALHSTRRSAQNCTAKLSEYSPGLAAFDDDNYLTVRFHGSFGLPSPYKGPPNPDVDARWSEVENSEPIPLVTYRGEQQ